MKACEHQFRITADPELGIASRVLDLLAVAGLVPVVLQLHCPADHEILTIDLTCTGGSPHIGALLGKFRRLPGVRSVD